MSDEIVEEAEAMFAGFKHLSIWSPRRRRLICFYCDADWPCEPVERLGSE